ncbi:MAG TPA: hypothetical protein VN950_12035 [Terriglobales bacterium]|nr:hypothetical protein [Terriglobales bacterium]
MFKNWTDEVQRGNIDFTRNQPRITFVTRRTGQRTTTLLSGVYTDMINKVSNLLLILAIGCLMFTGSAIAQTTTTSGAGPGVVDPGHPRVNQVNGRETNQQNRIANGVKNGSLTPKETSNLEKREASVQNREKRDMAAHNGHLTKAEQNGINRQQNRISRGIYRDKHN